MIGVVDYGSGNIRSILSLCDQIGVSATRVSTENDIKRASHLILPGVGSYDRAMSSLQKSGLLPALTSCVLQQQVPILGICVGMQIMGDSSDEGEISGLGWISGRVRSLRSASNFTGPVPHMGWNTCNVQRSCRILDAKAETSSFYFLHSYFFEPTYSGNIVATTTYGIKFCSVLNHKNIYGVQFHPEKSHTWGENLIRNFVEV